MRTARRSTELFLAMALCLVLMGASVARADEPAASAPPGTVGAAVVEARRFVGANMYQRALDVIEKELAAGRPGVQGEADRSELLSLKGESLLRIGNNVPAADAFAKASAAAVDVRASAMARANSILARQSPKHQYPLASGSGSIDVADPAARKQAFEAMHGERAKALAPQIERARAATAPGPLFELLPGVIDLGALEFAVKGSAPDAKALLTDLGSQALRLGNAEIRRLGRRVDQLDDLADSPGRIDPSGGGVVSRRGLHNDEERELDDLITSLRKIEQAARRIRAGVQQLGFGGERWEPVIADAGDLADRARALRDSGK